ncbi:MAG: septum formation initiator family protein [Treponema sp.]|nr:septum formation initiator family protein [Treponema sp.]
MGILKYLLAVVSAVAVYSVLSLTYGATGFSAYRELLYGRDIQRENIQKLGVINSTLENTQNSLLFDRNTLTVRARQLGYGYDSERFVRIVGLSGMENLYNNPGEVAITPAPMYISDRIIKICALFSGVMVFAFLFVFEIIRRQ